MHFDEVLGELQRLSVENQAREQVADTLQGVPDSGSWPLLLHLGTDLFKLRLICPLRIAEPACFTTKVQDRLPVPSEVRAELALSTRVRALK